LGLGLGLVLTNAGQAFNLLLLLGAGTGLIYILRWFWWRINAMTEIVAMIASLIIAGYFTFIHDGLGIVELAGWQKTVSGAILTTITWVAATYFTAPTDDKTLRKFYRLIKPGGNGWDAVIDKANAEGDTMKKEHGQLPFEILCFVVGCITIYSALFATGNWIYGNTMPALILTGLTGLGLFFLITAWGKLQHE